MPPPSLPGRDESPEPTALPAAAASSLGWRLEVAGELLTVVRPSEDRRDLFQHAVSWLRMSRSRSTISIACSPRCSVTGATSAMEARDLSRWQGGCCQRAPLPPQG
eukprot:9483405-Pyramimonas_sp.AAC.1